MRIARRFPLASILLGLVLALAIPDARSASCVYNATSGDWATPADWNNCNGLVPGPNDSAAIPATGIVTVDSTQSARQIFNAGSIDIAGSTLSILGTLGTSSNTGTITAGSSSIGSLVISSTFLGNTGGNLVANGAGSAISLSSTTISGGTLTTTNGGLIQATNSSSNFLSGVTLNGTVDLASATSIERVTGSGLTFTSGSQVNVDSNSILSFQGNQTLPNLTLGGTGTITLGAAGSGNRIAIDGNTTLTVGANILIDGQNGTIGQNFVAAGTTLLVNNGRISADVAGGSINLATTSTAANSITNSGTLEALNGGTLVLSSNVTGNAGSAINTGAGSTVVQNGVTLSGLVNHTGLGTLAVTNSGSNFLNGVTLNGTLDMTSKPNSRERIINWSTINDVLDGAIDIGNGGILSLDSANTTGGNQTIGGTGSINLNDASARLALDGTGTTTLGANLVVRGQGNIGIPAFTAGINNLVNNGLISADVSGGTLTITPGGGSGNLTNNGIMQVNAGATMFVTAALTNFGGNTLTGGTYIVNGAAGNTATMRLSSLGNSAAGEIVNNGASITLNGPNADTHFVDGGDNAALKPLATNSGGLTLSGGYAFTSNGNLANSGTVEVGAGSSLTIGPGAASDYNQSAGTTSVLGSLSAANVNINGGTLLGTGIVSGNATLASGAELLPGTSATAPGTLSFTGPVALNGTLDEVLDQSGFGLVSVTGSLTLSGASVLNLLQDAHYNPVAGTTLVIATAGLPVAGVFGSVLNPTFNAGTEVWNIFYNQGGNNIELIAANFGASTVTATWSTGSGNWTTAAQWSCTPGPQTCVPNNDANFAYNAILNSAGNTLTLDNTSNPPSVGVLSLLAQAGSLDIGTGSTLSVSGDVTIMNPATLQLSGGTLLGHGALGNDGTLIGNGAITGTGSLANTGAVYADGGTLDLSGFSITNLSGSTLTGGTWQAGVNSAGTLKLPGAIATNSAGIFLQNPGSQIVDQNGSNALAGLTSNQGGGLTLFNGATFTSGGSFTNNNGSALNSSFGGSSLTINGDLANTNSSLVNVNGDFGGASVAVLGNLLNDGTSTVQIQTGGVLAVSGSFNSDGTITQSSGTVTVGADPTASGGAGAQLLSLGQGSGSSSTYTLAGGQLTVYGNASFANSAIEVGGNGSAHFLQTGGRVDTYGVNGLAIADCCGGTSDYSLSGNGILNVNANPSLGSGGNAFIGAHGAGTMEQTGTSALTVAGNLYIGLGNPGPASGAFYLGGNASASIGGFVDIGTFANGTGTLDFNTLPGDAATLSIGNGLYVGDAGHGIVNQGGGNLTVGTLVIGVQQGGVGTHNVTAGGTTAVSGATYVGAAGTGTFVNDGSTHNTAVMIVGAAGTSSGNQYTLQNNGVLNVGQVGSAGFVDVAEHGGGTFIQTSGTTTLIGALDIGRCAGAGCLGAGDADVGRGSGTVNLNGGSMTVLFDAGSNYGGFVIVGDSRVDKIYTCACAVSAPRRYFLETTTKHFARMVIAMRWS